MTWQKYDSYGAPHEEAILNVVCMSAGQRGLIEIQVRPVVWEYLCCHFGNTRPVTTETREDKVSFVTACAGRVVRFYALDMGSDDYRFRVVEK